VLGGRRCLALLLEVRVVHRRRGRCGHPHAAVGSARRRARRGGQLRDESEDASRDQAPSRTYRPTTKLDHATRATITTAAIATIATVYGDDRARPRRARPRAQDWLSRFASSSIRARRV
jgi:hypothetical protein